MIQTVREKFTCRSCEKITQPPWAFSPRARPVGPFHVIARGHVGPSLLAMILYAKYGEHQPLNRPSETYAREGVDLDVSTLADHVGAGAAVLRPLTELIRRHVFAAERVHGDDTTVPLLAKGKTITARLWTYVRDDRPFAGPDPPARGVLLLAQSRRRASRPASRRLCRHPRRPMPMPGSANCMTAGANPGRSPRRRVGAMAGASSSSWPICARRHLRSRRSGASTSSSRSSARLTASRPATGLDGQQLAHDRDQGQPGRFASLCRRR